jgi:hypothetical protein
MTPFIRRVASIDALRKDGIDEFFFSGPLYAPVPQELAKTMHNLCMKTGVSVVRIKPRAATSEDEVEMFAMDASTADGRKTMKKLAAELGPLIVSNLQKSASSISEKSVLRSSSNQLFDQVHELCEFRDALMRLMVPVRQASSKNPILLIGTE